MTTAELLARLRANPDAATIVALARVGLGDVGVYERMGGDAVGTDEYERVRDAWPQYRELLAHADVEVRRAAAWLLAFLPEPAAETLPALDAAAADDVAIRVAAGRLRATVEGEVQVPWDGVELDEATRALPLPLRGAAALALAFRLPRFPRKCQPEVAEALAALREVRGVDGGPWGDGDLGAFAEEVKATLWVQAKKGAEKEAGAGAATEVFDGGGMQAVLTPAAAAEAATETAASASVSASAEEEEDDEEEEEEEDDIGEEEVDDPFTQQRKARGPGRVALPGLRDVDWAALEHAYGRATGVPGMLEALSSADEDDRDWALNALDGAIHHQGSVYSASTAAVPFLVRIADTEIEDRERILVLLCGIAVHQPEGCLVNGARQWRSEAYDAVVAGGATYVRLAGDADARVRCAAAFLLAYLEPVPAGALAALRARLRVETDRRARASELLAIGYLSRYLESKEDEPLLTAYLADPCPLVAIAAAAAVVQMYGPTAPRPAFDVLDRGRRTALPVRGFWPWNDGDLRGLAQRLRMAMKSLDEVLADLEAATAANDPEARGASAGKAFGMLFRDGEHDYDHPWLPAELDAPRRTVLAYFVETTLPKDGQKSCSLPYWDEAGAIGLFGDRDATRRVLGDLAGAADRDVGGRPAWAAIYAVLVGVTPEAELHAALAAIPADERVAIVDDAVRGPFRLHYPRRPTDYGVPGGPEKTNDYTSRAILLLADVLVAAGAPGAAWARAMAEEQRPLGKKRNAVLAVLAALVIARSGGLAPGDDVLLAIDQAPATTYRKALAAVIRELPLPRVLALVGEKPLWGYTAYQDPRGEVRRWRRGDGWDYLDLLPPAFAAERVRAAIAEWERHRAAGDDRQAQPVAGSVTSSIDNKPSPDEEFPHELARHYTADIA
jgi:hypothetical protein